MNFRSIMTLAITAAIALGSVNFVSASVVPGHRGGGGGTPAGGPSTPDTGSDDVFKVFLGDQPDCNRTSIAGVNCVVLPPKRRPRVFLIADPAHCVDTDHRRVVLPNGDVVIQQSKSKIKYCDDLHTMQ